MTVGDCKGEKVQDAKKKVQSLMVDMKLSFTKNQRKLSYLDQEISV